MIIWAPKNKDEAHPVRLDERVPGTFEVRALEGGQTFLSQLKLGDNAHLANWSLSAAVVATNAE